MKTGVNADARPFATGPFDDNAFACILHPPYMLGRVNLHRVPKALEKVPADWNLRYRSTNEIYPT
jgi:hypothetical protein